MLRQLQNTIPNPMKHIKSLRSKLAAFTLIELLVVISIIAVLASLALPAITGALVKGQITQTTSNYRQLYILTQTASLDNQQGGGAGAFPGDGGLGVAGWKSNLVSGSYCSGQTLTNLASIKNTWTNTLVWTNASSSSDASTIFLSTVGYSGASNIIAFLPTGPYRDKGGSIVTVGGAAYSLTGSNSPILTNGTLSGGTPTAF